MPPPLPPLATLRAFEAAARHESLTLAAAELGVTPSAVSHQLRALEDALGTVLFLRTPRQLRLTPAGARLAAGLAEGLARIAAAVEELRAAEAETVLRVSALPLFTSAWLIPRLGGFETRAARLGLRVTLSLDGRHAVADLARGEADIAIRNLPRRDPALATRRLLDLRAVPVCAPEMAARLATPADLAGATLIHVSARPEGWANWHAALGLPPPAPRAALAVDTVPAALDAAAAGR
ncbi:LysR family transcriptional regulator, partial [Paracraurococcus ruber]